MEETLILIKPDAIQRALAGKIISRFEEKGLIISGLKMMQLDESILKEHYAHIADKPFFPGLADFMKSSPVIACCIKGIDAVETVRKMAGVTNSRNAEQGTLRGDFAMSIQMNVIHASDSKENAKLEISRFFDPSEIHSYNLNNIGIQYTKGELGV